MKRQLFVASALLALAASGCSGTGSGAVPTNAAGSQSVGTGGTAAVTLKISPQGWGCSTNTRSPQYISINTGSIAVTAPGIARQVIPLSGSSGGCGTYSATFNAPIGNPSITISTYQSADGSGTALSQATQAINVTSAGPNNLSVTLDGVVAALNLAVTPNGLTNGTAASLTATWTALDASGATIIGPGALVNADGSALATPTLASNATAGITVGTYTASSYGGSWAVSYSGASTSTPVTFTLSATGVSNATFPVAVAGGTVAPQATAFPTPATPPNLTLSCNTSSQRCGVQRWHTKTLDDVDENQINWVPNLATVTQLNNLPVPSTYNENGPGGSDTGRFAPYEMQVFTVRALLVTRKHETGSSGDDDYHVEIADPNNPSATMVTEAPHGECTYACASGFGADFDQVRAELDACFGAASSSFQAFPAGVIVDLTGVGFFDGLHGQTGALGNPSSNGKSSNFELHPIVHLEFVSGKPTGVPGC